MAAAPTTAIQPPRPHHCSSTGKRFLASTEVLYYYATDHSTVAVATQPEKPEKAEKAAAAFATHH